jgi:hypothetical protein
MVFSIFTPQADAAISGTWRTSGHVDFYTYYFVNFILALIKPTFLIMGS